MNRLQLSEASRLSLAAADAATIAGSFSGIRPDRARHFIQQAEEALYAALDALAQAQMTDRASFLAVAAEVAQAVQREAA